MKKIYDLMVHSMVALAVALVAVSCNVDDAYDLSKLDTSDVGIGTDDTSFDLPLAEVSFNVEELIKGDSSDEDAFGTRSGDSDSESTSSSVVASDLLSTVNDLSKFLPDSYGAIELDSLNDEEYVGDLTEALLSELSSDSDKCLEFCQFAVDSEETYTAVFDTLVDVLPEYDIYETETFAVAFGDMLNDSESEELVASVKGSVVGTVVEESADFETNFEIEEVFDESIDIDSSTVDMLDSNLDGDKNTLSILFTLNTDLPLTMTFVPYIVLSDDAKVKLGDYNDETDVASLITADNFRDMLSQLKVRIEVVFSTYDPSLGDLDLSTKSLTVKLIARKTGSLKF